MVALELIRIGRSKKRERLDNGWALLHHMDLLISNIQTSFYTLFESIWKRFKKLETM